MGLLDRVTGRARPDDSTPAQPAERLRQALTAAPGPDAAWSVGSDGDDGTDLVTQWQVQEPRFAQLMGTMRDRTDLVELRMRLDEAGHEVRVVERTVTVTTTQGVVELSYEHDARAGVMHHKSWNKTIGGGTEAVFNDDDVKEPLKRATLDAGWQWHPVTHL